jgi:hypothetical protein
VAKEPFIPAERIERSILLIRGQKVMLDSDLAELYSVETKNLNKAVKRNLDRFPDDFLFQLTAEEAEALRFQSGTSTSGGRGGRRYLPNAFTEQGVAMLSSVLRSNRAVQVNIAIMRAFVRLREILGSHKDLAAKLAKLEEKLGEHDEKFHLVLRPSANSWPRRPRPRNAASASRPTPTAPRRASSAARPSAGEPPRRGDEARR